MAFERFIKTGRSSLPKVSIWSRGQIGFSLGAINKYDLDKFSHVVLLYDKEDEKVGFMFTNNEHEEGAVKLSVRKTGATVGAKPFLDYYEIDFSETRRYDMKYHKEQNLYVIDLKEQDSSDKQTE